MTALDIQYFFGFAISLLAFAAFASLIYDITESGRWK